MSILINFDAERAAILAGIFTDEMPDVEVWTPKDAIDPAKVKYLLTWQVAVADAARRAGVAIPALIEIDCDGHRGGVSASDVMLLKIAGILDGQGCMQGVITHAGESYGVAGYKAHAEFAEIAAALLQRC